MHRQSVDTGCISFCYKSSAVVEMGDRGHNRHGPKRGGCSGCAPFAVGGAGSPYNTMRPGLVYFRTKWHLDPSNRLAALHQRHRQDRQRSDSTGRTVLQTVAQKWSVRRIFLKFSSHELFRNTAEQSRNASRSDATVQWNDWHYSQVMAWVIWATSIVFLETITQQPTRARQNYCCNLQRKHSIHCLHLTVCWKVSPSRAILPFCHLSPVHTIRVHGSCYPRPVNTGSVYRALELSVYTHAGAS